MMEKIYAIVKKPGEAAGEIKEIDNTLRALQELIGGHIEAVPYDEGFAVICDNDGRLKGYPHNCNFGGFDYVGSIVIVGIEDDDFTDCPLELDELDEWMEDND